jgi:hypothetical protein
MRSRGHFLAWVPRYLRCVSAAVRSVARNNVRNDGCITRQNGGPGKLPHHKGPSLFRQSVRARRIAQQLDSLRDDLFVALGNQQLLTVCSAQAGGGIEVVTTGTPANIASRILFCTPDPSNMGNTKMFALATYGRIFSVGSAARGARAAKSASRPRRILYENLVRGLRKRRHGTPIAQNSPQNLLFCCKEAPRRLCRLGHTRSRKDGVIDVSIPLAHRPPLRIV